MFIERLNSGFPAIAFWSHFGSYSVFCQELSLFTVQLPPRCAVCSHMCCVCGPCHSCFMHCELLLCSLVASSSVGPNRLSVIHHFSRLFAVHLPLAAPFFHLPLAAPFACTCFVFALHVTAASGIASRFSAVCMLVLALVRPICLYGLLPLHLQAQIAPAVCSLIKVLMSCALESSG